MANELDRLQVLRRDRDAFIAAVRSGILFRLSWIKFKIIDGCNIRCVMCNHWRREEYLRSYLTTERLLRLGDELAELGTKRVNWSGGEPTLQRDLPEIIGRYNALGMRSSMISNGTRLTESVAERLLDAGLESAILSLESSDAATHDKVVGHPGAWQKLIDGVTHLRRRGGDEPRVLFTTVLTSINTNRDLVPMVPLAARLGVTQVRMGPVYVDHLREEERALLPTAEQIERYQNEILPEMLDLGRTLGVQVNVDGGEIDGDGFLTTATAQSLMSADGNHSLGHYRTHTCYLPTYHTTVNWRGDVLACCHIGEDGVFGNIAEQPLIDVLQSEAARRFRLGLATHDVPPPCAECVMNIGENAKIEQVLYAAE